MDLELRNNEDLVEHRQNLAVGNFARPRLRQPIDLEKDVSRGTVFEYVEGDDDWDPYENCEGEYYEDDTYNLFESYVPISTTYRVMGADAPEEKYQHFDLSRTAALTYDEIEKEMQDLNEEGTVKKMIIRPGNGTKVPDKCRIYYHFMAVAEGREEAFEISLMRRCPPWADLRREEFPLLPGFDLSIRSMQLREAARFIVYPEMAFGQAGCLPRIPKNAKLLYVIETIQFIDEERLNTPLFMSADMRSTLPFEKILSVSNTLRTEGNGLYQSQSLQLAIRKWRKGIQFLEDYPCSNGEDCQQRCNILHTLYSNVAQAYLKLEKPAQACNACKLGLKLVEGEDSIKLLYRFAKAKFMFKDCDAALHLVKEGLKINKHDVDLKTLEKEIRAEDALQTKAHKNMCGKMFNGGSKKVPPASTKTGKGYPLKTVPDKVPQLSKVRSTAPSPTLKPVMTKLVKPSIAPKGVLGETGKQRKDNKSLDEQSSKDSAYSKKNCNSAVVQDKKSLKMAAVPEKKQKRDEGDTNYNDLKMREVHVESQRPLVIDVEYDDDDVPVFAYGSSGEDPIILQVKSALAALPPTFLDLWDALLNIENGNEICDEKNINGPKRDKKENFGENRK